MTTTLNAEVQKRQKTAKIGGFRRQRTTEYTDRDDISQINVDHGSAIALALIRKRGSVQEPPNVKICPKLWFLATGSRHNEHIHIKFGL